MKFLTKFYYLPFLIGIIISILLWISSYDAKLRTEGFAKINTNHSLTNLEGTIYWKTIIKEITEKYNSQTLLLTEKRDVLRFESKNNDIEEIRKNYQDINNEFKKYKKIYLAHIENRIKNELELKKLSKKIKKKIKNGKKYLIILSEKKFLLDLKTNEVIIHNYQFISITLLVSFFVTVILYNVKKYF
jgi:hypothetical protein